MPRQIRTLIIEDSEEDTALLLRELKNGGYDPIHERVETREELQHALRNQDWDVIFSDYTMPVFKGTDALALLRVKGDDIPFIFVSGTIGEDMAVIAMKAGANDYIIKGHLKRLVPAVDRELRESAVRRERKNAEGILRESNQTLQAIVKLSPVAIILTSPRGIVQMWNTAAERIFGWSEQEILGHPLPIIPEERMKAFDVTTAAVFNGKAFLNLDLRHKRKDGLLIETSLSTSSLRNAKGEILGIIWFISTLTERKR